MLVYMNVYAENVNVQNNHLIFIMLIYADFL